VANTFSINTEINAPIQTKNAAKESYIASEFVDYTQDNRALKLG
jgi:hypothetical protein